MKRTSLFFDEPLLRSLAREARRRDTSVAAVVREAVAAYLAHPRGATVPSVTGQFASGTTDTSERAHELLWRDPHA